MNVTISCDLGEATSAETRAVEDAIWPQIDAANIACGGHVGDEESMRLAVRLALEHGVAIGAHPSYPDRENFGRRSMAIDGEELRAALLDQLDALARIATEEGGALLHMKPHGALYNDAHSNRALAGLIARVASERSLLVVASHRSVMEEEARTAGCPVTLEGFADRRYRSDFSLQPRSEEGSLLLDFDEAAEQARRLANGDAIVASDGTRIVVPCETICIHSDMPDAVARLARIRSVLPPRVSAGRR